MKNKSSRIIAALISTAFLMPCALAQSESDSSVDTKKNDTIMKGRVEKLDGASGSNLPRIARPASSGIKDHLDALTAGSSMNSDALKARVMQAAGLGGVGKLDSSEAKGGKASQFSLNTQELQSLSKFDITVLVDASGSMSQPDCEPLNVFNGSSNISRWEWCRQQTSVLVQEVSPVFPVGITVIPFASGAQRYTNVSPALIGNIFNDVRPGGGTRLDAALGLEFNTYFEERAKGMRKKPLLIAVITDGVPNFPAAVADEILDLIKRVKPGEVRIEFFLIGEARRGAFFVDVLSNLRLNAGAPFEVVKEHTFEELCEQGLPRSLAHAVMNAGRK